MEKKHKQCKKKIKGFQCRIYYKRGSAHVNETFQVQFACIVLQNCAAGHAHVNGINY